MGICVKGQKFLQGDLELKEFITTDLKNFFNDEFERYFLRAKDTAIKISQKLNIEYQKEKNELYQILNLKDNDFIKANLTEIEIKKKDFIKQSYEKRLSILESLKYKQNYIDILKALVEYYKLKEYTTITDINYLSRESKILIFSYEDTFYTSLDTDNEELFENFLLESKKFQDFSYSSDEITPKAVSDKELEIEITKENVWTNIYSSFESTKGQIGTVFVFDLFSDENISRFSNHKNYNDIHSLLTSNINF